MQSIRRQCQLNKATFFDESLPSDFLLGTGIRCDSQSWLLNYSETSVMVRHLRHALRELCEGRRLSSGSWGSAGSRATFSDCCPFFHTPFFHLARCDASIADLASASGTSSHGFLRAHQPKASTLFSTRCTIPDIIMCSRPVFFPLVMVSAFFEIASPPGRAVLWSSGGATVMLQSVPDLHSKLSKPLA